jgi:hypothetical protein
MPCAQAVGKKVTATCASVQLAQFLQATTSPWACRFWASNVQTSQAGAYSLTPGTGALLAQLHTDSLHALFAKHPALSDVSLSRSQQLQRMLQPELPSGATAAAVRACVQAPGDELDIECSVLVAQAEAQGSIVALLATAIHEREHLGGVWIGAQVQAWRAGSPGAHGQGPDTSDCRAPLLHCAQVRAAVGGAGGDGARAPGGPRARQPAPGQRPGRDAARRLCRHAHAGRPGRGAAAPEMAGGGDPALEAGAGVHAAGREARGARRGAALRGSAAAGAPAAHAGYRRAMVPAAQHPLADGGTSAPARAAQCTAPSDWARCDLGDVAASLQELPALESLTLEHAYKGRAPKPDAWLAATRAFVRMPALRELSITDFCISDPILPLLTVHAGHLSQLTSLELKMTCVSATLDILTSSIVQSLVSALKLAIKRVDVKVAFGAQPGAWSATMALDMEGAPA